MAQESLHYILILLSVAVVAIVLLRRFRLPAVLAYLATGIVVGPHGLGWIPDVEDTRVLAEFGVVFMLFTLGLEFSLPRLLSMKREVLVLGGLQVVITAGLAGTLVWGLGYSAAVAVVVGGAFAMSSTAIVAKQLSEQLELNLMHGRLSIGVLLFQDLAVIPLLIMIPAMSGNSHEPVSLDLIEALLKGVVALSGVILIGRWLLRPIFHEIALARSAELFTLAVLFFSLSAAWSTAALGLSLALGAFLAGMMLGETEFRHQVEADIRPFRDVLLGLFFVTVGMLLNVPVLLPLAGWILLALAGLILFKLLAVMLLARL
ncbi:MAG: monovalent cation:proton antiporter-2 (CPA2) family protein, partial [Gammaproteobacteria bacterium]